MNALVTGSQVYGTPKSDSDVDLVVLVSVEDYAILSRNAEPDDSIQEKSKNYDGIGGLRASLRFGKLNVLVTTDPLAFEVWRRGTDELKRDADTNGPVSRAVAVRLFNAMRDHHGLYNAAPCVERRAGE